MNKEEYEIILISDEGRAILNKQTKKIYHSEFEIIEEKNKEIDRLNNIINKAKIKIESMFNVGDETKIIDDLLKLNKILSGSDGE